MMRGLRIAGFALVLLIPSLPTAARDVVVQAMRHELERSMQDLRLEDLSKPYFISYTVHEVQSTRASASFGSLLTSSESVRRWLTVEVRVGSYDLDNTNFFSLPTGRSGVLWTRSGRVPLPLEDDYRAVRRQLWLATDSVYKEALETLSKKRAAMQNKTRSEELPDFSKQEPAKVEDDAAPAEVDRNRVESLVRRLSTRFREMAHIHTSEVGFRATTLHTRYLNSEGSSFTRTTPTISLVATASTRAEDGLPLEDFVSAYGRSLEDLPSEADLAAAIDRMGGRLAGLRSAPLLERYNGPVLFEGQAAAELMAQGFATGLLAARQPVLEDARMAGFMSRAGGGSLEDKIGARVLPRFLAVVDDPTRVEYEKALLLGGYKVDDQGVPAGPTPVIERGILKTLLSGRTPVSGVEHSTGNQRGGSVMPSNVIVTVDRPMTPEELKQELLLLVADREGEFGVIVRRMGNPRLKSRGGPPGMFIIGGPGGRGNSVENPIEAYKVYPDGREELIRNVQIPDIGSASFKDIVAASSEHVVYTAPFDGRRRSNPFGGMPPGARSNYVSWVVPSLLFEDLTLKKPGGEIPRPPIAEHPYFERPDD
jgi:predicted Zn-dependent protease